MNTEVRRADSTVADTTGESVRIRVVSEQRTLWLCH